MSNYAGLFPHLDLMLLTDLPGIVQRVLPPAPKAALARLKAADRQFVTSALRLYARAGRPPISTATLVCHLHRDADETGRACYKKFGAYPALPVRWAETGLEVWDDFHDGNVPPSYRNRDALTESIDYLNHKLGVSDVWGPSDAADCQHDLLEMLADWPTSLIPSSLPSATRRPTPFSPWCDSSRRRNGRRSMTRKAVSSTR